MVANLLVLLLVYPASSGSNGDTTSHDNAGVAQSEILSDADIDAWEGDDDDDDDVTVDKNGGCSSSLRSGWEEYYSEEVQRHYYFHKESRETTWSFPSACQAEDSMNPSPSAEDAGLPAGWKKSYSEQFNSFYFHTKERSQWVSPARHEGTISPKIEYVDTGPLLPSEKHRKVPKKQRPLLATVQVNKFGSFSDSCGKPDRPCGGIQQGINRASDRARIYVHPGWYNGVGNFFLDFQGKHIELISVVDKEAVIDCENRGPVINPMVPSGHLQINGFRIVDCPMSQNGKGTLPGPSGGPLEFSTKLIQDENGRLAGVLDSGDGSPLVMTQEMTDQLSQKKLKRKYRKKTKPAENEDGK
jgi:hypothetical protein